MTLTQPIIHRIDKRGSRHYIVEGDDRVEGIQMPSVTTVLGVIAKPALIPWARNVALEKARATLIESPFNGLYEVWPDYVTNLIEAARKRPDEVKTQAADLGTRAHMLLSEIIEGKEPEIPAELAQVVSNFQDWLKDSGLRLDLSEQMVYCPECRYAGSMDLTAWRGDELVCIDLKTSNGIYDEYALQIAAYAHAWAKMGHKVAREGWAVRLGKDKPDFEARKINDLDAAFGGFEAALALWRSLKVSPWADVVKPVSPKVRAALAALTPKQAEELFR